MAKEYDVIIAGGGIIGSAILYTLSRYTDIRSILLVEKYKDLALLNSNSASNSQTLHFGDIETHYSLDKAKKTKEGAERILRYTYALPSEERGMTIQKCQKMVLGVGEQEIELLERTYSQGFRELFPQVKKIGRNELNRLEPNVVKGRDASEKVLALFAERGYMINFSELSHSFVNSARRNKKIKIDVMFGAQIKSVEEGEQNNTVKTRHGEFKAQFVDVAAGIYSLYFAKALGYQKNLSAFPVSGNFYYSPCVLRGKVYQVQVGGIPFVQVHGDPDITNPGVTRFGPTVSLTMQLERHNAKTILDYFKMFNFDLKMLSGLREVLSNKNLKAIIKKNVVYGMPILGKAEFFKKEVTKIVPSLKSADLHFANDISGIRPQLIDEDKKALVLGEARIVGRHNTIFNIAPSPGATSCLSIALLDAMHIAKALDIKFDREKYVAELGPIYQ